MAIHSQLDKESLSYKVGDVLTLDGEELCGTFLPLVQAESPDKSIFQCLRSGCKAVCPKGLIDAELSELVEMESFCRDYHVPPYGAGSGYADYPLRMIDAFSTISIARERVRAKEMASIQRQQGANAKSPGSQRG